LTGFPGWHAPHFRPNWLALWPGSCLVGRGLKLHAGRAARLDILLHWRILRALEQTWKACWVTIENITAP